MKYNTEVTPVDDHLKQTIYLTLYKGLRASSTIWISEEALCSKISNLLPAITKQKREFSPIREYTPALTAESGNGVIPV